jgi:hypothetical protein
MKTLNRLLRFLFFIEAVVFGIGGLEVGWRAGPQLRQHLRQGDISQYQYALLVGMWALTVLAGIAAALAWRSMKHGGPWARRWGFAASILTLPVLPLGTVVGILGLIGMLGYQRETPPPLARRNTPVLGDGTTRLSGFIFVGIQWGFAWVGFQLLADWARRTGLQNDTPWPLGVAGAAVMAAVLVHEFGHFLAGWACRFRLCGFRVGPVGWDYREGRWHFKWRADGLLGGGSTAMAPTLAEGIRERAMFFVAGGPVASALLGLLAASMLLHAPGSPWRHHWYFIGLLACWGLCDFLSNLLPVATAIGYSDGARLWQFWRRGPWSEYLTATYYMTISLSTPMLPRDWPTTMVVNAARFPGRPPEKALAEYLAYMHFEDRGDIESAGRYLNALSQTVQNDEELSEHYALEIAFYSAAYCGNADLGWQWLDKGKDPDSADYLRAKAAVLAAEGDLVSARDVWQQGWAIASGLPSTGVYETDRRYYTLIAERWLGTLPSLAAALNRADPVDSDALPGSEGAAQVA